MYHDQKDHGSYSANHAEFKNLNIWSYKRGKYYQRNEVKDECELEDRKDVFLGFGQEAKDIDAQDYKTTQAIEPNIAAVFRE